MVQDATETVNMWLNQPGAVWLATVLVLLAGWYGSKLVVRLVGRRVARRFQRPSITKTILRSIRMTIILASLAVVAQLHGLGAENLLLSVTVFSVVLGLILAPVIGSVINGLFVLADRPYEIGDMIELVDERQRGFVEDITLRYTKVFTLDNAFLVIPNSTMRERDVINYSAEDERSRLSLDLLVRYEDDVDQARAIMEEVARDTPDVIDSGPDIRIGSARYPAAPVTHITEFADDGVRLALRYWVRNPYRIPSVEAKIRERVREQFMDAGIQIPYPHRHIVYDSGEESTEWRSR